MGHHYSATGVCAMSQYGFLKAFAGAKSHYGEWLHVTFARFPTREISV